MAVPAWAFAGVSEPATALVVERPGAARRALGPGDPITLGIDREGVLPPLSEAAFDVLLTTAETAPSPWVTSRDMDADIAALAGASDTHAVPAAAGRLEAHADAVFRLPELAMGLIPGAGGTASLPRRIGRHRTAFMALTGRGVDAGTALGWGLIDAMAAPS